MEDDANFPPAIISSKSPKFSDIQEDGCRTEKMKCIAAKALDILFANEISLDSTYLEPHLFSRKRTSSLYFVEKSARASFPGNHESAGNTFKMPREDIFSFRGKNIQLTTRLSSGNANTSDEIFFSSDGGKEMLLKDEEKHAKEFMYKIDPSCTPCSLWTVGTRKGLPDLSSLVDVDHKPSERHFTVGEFINATEPSDLFSDDQFRRQTVNFGRNASTPLSQKKFSFGTSLSEINETALDLNIEDKHEYKPPLWTMPLCPVLLYSPTPQTKKIDYPQDFDYYIGSTNYENIQRLKAEEKMKFFSCNGKLSFTLDFSSNLAETTIGFLPGSSNSFGFDKTILLRNSTTKTSLESSQGNDSVIDEWTVQPQELTLDIKSKGSRLLLINNSKKDFKFKNTFDGRIISVCPLSGILPANSQLGLRVLVSRFLRGKSNKLKTEDVIKITCGKKEKKVCVKICNENSQNILSKERSYICF